MKLRALALTAAGVLLSGFAGAAALYSRDLPSSPRFNQFEIAGLLRGAGAFDTADSALHVISSLSARVHALTAHEPVAPDFDESATVIDAVVRAMPYLAIVYPTEGYYYFAIDEGEGEIAGNLRVNDLERGAIGYGYYRRSGAANRLSPPKAGYITESDGLRVEQLTERMWWVSFNGRWRFILTPSTHEEPPPLRKNESFVTWVRDESGLPFYLVFDDATPSFFFVLDERKPLPDQLAAHGALLVGARTKFAFVEEAEPRRKLLVGVQETNIRANTYYDGPFDQIPAYLPLRERAYRAYPYLKLGGTDEFGYLCPNPLIRVGVNPYLRYEKLPELERNVEMCRSLAEDARQLRHCLTFDHKQVYHHQSEVFDKQGNLPHPPASCEHIYLPGSLSQPL